MTQPKRGGGHGRNYDYYEIVPRGGGDPVDHARATTISGALSEPEGDSNNLSKWSRRMVARGLAARPDLLALVQVAGPETDWREKHALNDICSDAKEAAAASSGANRGTALHKLLERLDGGEEIVVPTAFERDVGAYHEMLSSHGIAIVRKYIERVCVCTSVGEPVAGTVDRLVSYRDKLYIADLKTGKSLHFGQAAMAVQLAIYANSDALYQRGDKRGQWVFAEDMPPVSTRRAIIFHLPFGSGECVPYWFDIAAGWEAAKLSVAVRAWRERDDLSAKVPAVRKKRAPAKRRAAQASIFPEQAAPEWTI